MTPMESSLPGQIFLKDYTPPAWRADSVELDVDFQDAPPDAEGTRETQARVAAHIVFVRAPETPPETPLCLDGAELETLRVEVDGRPWPHRITARRLTLLCAPAALPERFTLTTTVRLYPNRNTALSGLYRSRNGYFTQCEAEGFRRITWFPDRPDVMAVYRVTLHADKARFPVLLSNGNPVASGEEENGRHFATWHDPFRKPCYLFALVAARLEALRDTFLTAEGKTVQLAIYAEPGKTDQCAHALQSLKKAMRWDERRFGLSCDLEHYMIVAVSDFNMGAMENKGLNIFNAKYVLARPDLSTDQDFENIDRVVAHEYFHNWTGNRVTCRDWFQLSLKEGLTVFRDQEFGADEHDFRTARIRETRALRAAQFPEDAGPMAHSVRPEAYLAIDNFYTATVYEKGAEVVRMMETLIGREAFLAGMREYFRRHDGEAVTCEDFVAAMAAVSGFDFSVFLRWYSHPGTPRVTAQGAYDAERKRYALRLRQENPAARARLGESALPQSIPLAAALFDNLGKELPGSARVLRLENTEETFFFENVSAPPVPSLLRGFSAPVILETEDQEEHLALLLAHERDPFAAWEAGQRLATKILLKIYARQSVDSKSLVDAFRRLLQTRQDDARDDAFIAECLALPGESVLLEHLENVDPARLRAAREELRGQIARALEETFSALYEALAPSESYCFDSRQSGRRALRGLCLSYLLERENPRYRQWAARQFMDADNMTERFTALACLANTADAHCPERDAVLDSFYQRWHDEDLVVDKWLSAQASGRRADTFSVVRGLLSHPAYDAKNPNKVYALLRAFSGNLPYFHAADGTGYRLLAEEIRKTDARNPQLAARLARAFDRWKKMDAPRQTQARAALTSLREHPGLSDNLLEIVTRALD